MHECKVVIRLLLLLLHHQVGLELMLSHHGHHLLLLLLLLHHDSHLFLLLGHWVRYETVTQSEIRIRYFEVYAWNYTYAGRFCGEANGLGVGCYGSDMFIALKSKGSFCDGLFIRIGMLFLVIY